MDVRTLALAPVLLVQALWVMARAARLPEPEGARHGTSGTGRLSRFLVIGDSSAAGVGVDHQSHALGGQLAQALAPHRRVTWRVVAASGATVKSTRAILDTMPDEPFDFVVIALGVNDTKNGEHPARWESGYRDLLTEVSKKFGAPRICVSGVPPLRDFPLLPYPLSDVLGTRAERFDRILRQIAEERADTVHLPMDFPLSADSMATDGFHPGATVYREWARRAAAVFLDAKV